MSKAKQITDLLADGAKYDLIREIVGCSNGTIAYHARKIGIVRGRTGWTRKLWHDWGAVQKDVDAGMTLNALREKYGFAKASFTKAVKVGRITLRKRMSMMTLDEFCEHLNGRRASSYHRKLIRTLLIAEGRPDKCETCELSEWNGNRLTLEVDHRDGDPRHNKRENFRLICPNCHSTTPTWRGRNIRKQSRFES